MDIEKPPEGCDLGRLDGDCLGGQSLNSTSRNVPQLWPCQVAVVDKVKASISAGRKRLLLTMPTGGGKTVVAAHLMRELPIVGKRLFVAHRHELITQASRKLLDVGLGDHGIIKAGFPQRLHCPVQVGSVQTIHARAFRTRKIELSDFGLIVIDECHHSRAQTYQQIIDRFPNAIILGLTATPCRGDGLGLGNIFQELIEGPSVAELIRLGLLVDGDVYAPYRPDLRGIRIDRKKADYDEGQLAAVMNRQQLVCDIVTHWFRHAGGRPTVCFATGVKHSIAIRDEFRAQGVLAEHLDGKTPRDERDEILRRLATGEIQVVSNCAVLTEGWDQPSVSCLILARPTRQLGLFRQMVGRVLRIHPGKDKALILDHAGATFDHGFVDDPIYWPLHSDDYAVNQAHAARKEQHHRGLTTCPECSAVRNEGDPCHACGWKPTPKPKHVEFADGDLGLVQRDKSVHGLRYDELLFYQQLMHIAKARGRQPGYAAHKFKEKFGHFPPRAWNRMAPLPAEPAVVSWARSRDIAYAKAMQRRGAR